MSDSRSAGSAVSLDRLPWLSDEPAKMMAAPKRAPRELAGWAVALVLIVAAVSFWLGSRSEPANPPVPTSAAPPAATVAIPEPAAPQPEVRIARTPEVLPATTPLVRPNPAPQVRIAPPASRLADSSTAPDAAPSMPAADETSQPTDKQATPPAAAKVAPPARLTPWPPRVTSGAYGRLVQIGAFGSVEQAKLGWRYMVGAYPAVAHLPAVVRPDRNSRGRVFYRFRIGTTSQAHSEVLCQRMKRITLSCAVVGLPWKAKVER